MDDEAKQLIKEDLDIAKENNKLLTTLVRHQRWTSWLNVLKWIIVVGSAIGAIYYLEPILSNLWGTYQELLGIANDTSIKVIPGQF